MREYECLLILPAEADEALVGTATDRIQKVVAKHDGQVHGVDRWGRRRLAYEIDRRTEGYYVVVTFAAEPAAQAELDRTLNLADEVVRFKTVVLPAKRAQQVKPSPAAVGGATRGE